MSAVLKTPLTPHSEFQRLRNSLDQFDALTRVQPTPAPAAPRQSPPEIFDDAAMIGALAMHHAVCGSYDLCADSNPKLIRWQSKLLSVYLNRGCASLSLRRIESALDDFRIGQWMAPGEVPVPRQELTWWDTALAIRNTVRPDTAQRSWLQKQIIRARGGQLSPRQRAELYTMGLLAPAVQTMTQPVAISASQRTCSKPRRVPSNSSHPFVSIGSALREAAKMLPFLNPSVHGHHSGLHAAH